MPSDVLHTLPDGVAVAPGNGGLEKIVIERPEASAEIYLYGAQVTSWRPGGAQEVLFLSEHSQWQQGKAIRGGIPVCFPWFRGKADDPKAPSHGFARTRVWTLDAVTALPDGVRVSLSLVNDAGSEQWWPYAFRLEHHITVGNTLTLELTTRNTGTAAFRFEEAQHTYFRVGDTHDAQVEGLDGALFLDNTDGNSAHTQHGAVTPVKQTDNAYQGSTAALTLREDSGDTHLSITKEGSQSTVVWTPWEGGAAKLADLGNNEWEHFLCVEAANIRDYAVELAPGQQHTLRTHIAQLG